MVVLSPSERIEIVKILAVISAHHDWDVDPVPGILHNGARVYVHKYFTSGSHIHDLRTGLPPFAPFGGLILDAAGLGRGRGRGRGRGNAANGAAGVVPGAVAAAAGGATLRHAAYKALFTKFNGMYQVLSCSVPLPHHLQELYMLCQVLSLTTCTPISSFLLCLTSVCYELWNPGPDTNGLHASHVYALRGHGAHYVLFRGRH